MLDRKSFTDQTTQMQERVSPGMAELDGAGVVCAANAALDRLLAEAPGASVGQVLVNRVADEDCRRLLRDSLARASGFCRRDSPAPRRGRLLRRDGREIPVQFDVLSRAGSGVVVVVTDLRARHRAVRRLRMVSGRLASVQEQERRHLARELHDEVGQQLTGLALLLARSDASALSQAQAVVRNMMAQVRDLALRLRPALLDDLGLLPALLCMVERTRLQTGLDVTLTHQGLDERLPVDVETAAFRIIQEALTNVARHAGLVPVSVRVWREAANLCLEVEDQGSGFDPSVLTVRKGVGLESMRERAAILGGTWSIGTTSRGGTSVRADLPLGSFEKRDDTNVAVDRSGG